LACIEVAASRTANNWEESFDTRFRIDSFRRREVAAEAGRFQGVVMTRFAKYGWPCVLLGTFAAAAVWSQDQPAAKSDAVKQAAPPGLGGPQSLVRLSPDHDIWVDLKRKLVVVDGKIVLREGLLEMFACPKGTKEHESIVAVNCNAQFIHAGLIAVGAEPGSPVSFLPEYKAATGPEVEIWVLWKDAQGQNQKVRAQEWIQHSKTGNAMEYPWVFGGSGISVDELTGKKYYLADAGDLICVSNFTSAMLDLPVPSSQSNEDLTFRPYTERIPPVGTPVRLVLVPQPPKEKPETAIGAKPTAKPAGKP
jgi:hypothetical protein